MMLATMSYLRIVHRWDPLSALLGASPGAMAQVIALSTELGGDLRAIAIVQTVRVLLLVIGLPNGLALFGLVVPAVPVARGPAGLCRARRDDRAGRGVDRFRAWRFLRLRFPGGLLFGAMAGSAILHGTGLIHAALPWWIGWRVGDHARRAGRLALRQHVVAHAGRLSRRRARLVRGVDGGRDGLHC